MESCAARARPPARARRAKCGRLSSGSSANGGIVIRPATFTGRGSEVVRQLLRGDPGLALLAGDVDLEQDLGLGSPCCSSWLQRRLATRPSGSAPRSGRICLTLRDCSWPMKCQRKSGCAVAFSSRSWARFSPSSVIPASAARRSPSTGTYLTAARMSTSPGSRPAAAIASRTRSRFARIAAGVQAGDQARHTTPAWRPVTPWSRRWEKKRSSHIVHRPVSCTLDARGVELRAGDDGEVEVASLAARRARRSARGPPRRPRSSSRARRGRWRRRAGRRRRARAAPGRPRRGSRRPAGASRSAAPPRRRRPASITGRQSAVNTIAAASSSAVAWPSSSRVRARVATAARWRGGPSRRAPGARSRSAPTGCRPSPQPERGSRDVLGRVVGQQAEVQRRERPGRHAAAADEKTTWRGRSLTSGSFSQRKITTQEGRSPRRCRPQLFLAARRASAARSTARASPSPTAAGLTGPAVGEGLSRAMVALLDGRAPDRETQLRAAIPS